MLGAMNAATQAVQGKFNMLEPLLDERTRRLWAAAGARAIGVIVGVAAVQLARMPSSVSQRQIRPVRAASSSSTGS